MTSSPSGPLATEILLAEAAGAPDPDEASGTRVRARIDDILRPAGSMARLEEVAQFLACWQRTATPSASSPVALIFAADHGVVAEGVSAYPAEVTASMMAAFNAEKASISALARIAGATVTAIDVGVGRPTGNIRVEAALTPERLAEAFTAGREAVREVKSDLLILGEMGIGNTTAATAVCAALLDKHPSEVIGRGTGINREVMAHKQQVVEDALQRIEGQSDPLEILREVGGAELAAIAGALFEARMRSIPVLLDGFIATVPALVLQAISYELTANCLASHRSEEPGHSAALDRLRLDPLLQLNMRLGEASGAMTAVPLVKMACALVNEVPTFTEWFGSQ